MWTQFYTQLPTFKPYNLFLATVLKKKKRKNTLFLPTSYLSPTSSYIECPLTINHIYLPNPFTSNDLSFPIDRPLHTSSTLPHPLPNFKSAKSKSPNPRIKRRNVRIKSSKKKKSEEWKLQRMREEERKKKKGGLYDSVEKKEEETSIILSSFRNNRPIECVVRFARWRADAR